MTDKYNLCIYILYGVDADRSGVRLLHRDGFGLRHSTLLGSMKTFHIWVQGLQKNEADDRSQKGRTS